MQRTAGVLLVLLLFLLGVAGAIAEEEPTEQEKKELAVQLTRLLEREPFHEEAKEARAWLTRWLIEVPDVTVYLCGSFLGPVFEKDKRYSSELLVQMGYSQAAFVIENPDMADDMFALYKAGLLGSLRAYESMLDTKPRARMKYMDELIEKRQEGEIDGYVQATMKECDG